MFEACCLEFKMVPKLKCAQNSDLFFQKPASNFKWRIQGHYPHISLFSISAPPGEVKVISKFSIDCNVHILDAVFTGERNKKQNIMSINISKDIKGNDIGHLIDIKVNVWAYCTQVEFTPNKYATTLLPSMLKNSDFCDLIINAGSSNFKVHKSIFAEVSPVFRAMLLSDMKEKQTSCIVIKDFESDIVQKMIHFIYHGEVDTSSVSIVNELLRISDKYNIRSLQDYCVTQTKNMINKGNIIQIMSQIDFKNIPDLKNYAINYLVQNMKIYSPDTFKDIMKTNSELFPDLLSKISEKLNAK